MLVSLRTTKRIKEPCCASLLAVAVVFSVVMPVCLGNVAALSRSDVTSIIKQSPFYDPNDTGTVCASTQLSGSDNQQKAWNFFKSKGLPDVLVAAVFGNLMQESGINPTIMEIGGNSNDPRDAGEKGYGIAQWTPGYKILVNAETNKITAPIYLLSTQLDLVWAQMNGVAPTGYQNFLDDFKQFTSNDQLADAVAFFQQKYESGANFEPRLAFAQQGLQRYGSGGGDSGPVNVVIGQESTGTNQCNSTDTDPSNGGNNILPTGTAQELAIKLREYIDGKYKGKVQCNSESQRPNCPDIIKTAIGSSIQGGSCYVNALHPTILAMLLKLAQMGHSIVLSAICSDHPSNPTSKHHYGRAVDFNIVDGVWIGGGGNSPWTGDILRVMKKLDGDIASFMPKDGTRFNQLQCHPKFDFLSGYVEGDPKDNCNHQHVDYVKGL